MALLIALAGLTELAYAALLLFEPRLHIVRVMFAFGALFAFYAAAIFIVRKHRPAMWIVLSASILFRVTLIPLGLDRTNLFLDDDVWRYLWDGHVTAHFGNPYAFAPNQLAAGGLWGQIHARINHPELPTIYPPAAQVIFLAAHELAPGSVAALKILLIGCDLACIALVAACLRRLGRPPSEVILYAWNPLVIVMFAGAAHIDVLMLLFLAFTAHFVLREWKRSAGIALGLAVLAKIAPLVLLPLLVRRVGKGATAVALTTIALGSLPFLLFSGGGVKTFAVFANNWDFNSAAFTLLRAIGGTFVARIVSGIAILVVVIWIAHRNGSFADDAANTIGILVLLSPTVMPWYATWPLIFAAISRRPAVWLWFSALVCLSFPMTLDWKTDPLWLAVEYGGLAAIALFSRVPTARPLQEAPIQAA